MPGISIPIHILAGYLYPGKPLANMYSTISGYQSLSQAALLARNLNFAQYAHLSPWCTFTMHLTGTVIGAVAKYFIMAIIVDNKRDVLLALKGTNFWPGQAIQDLNAQSIAWGGLTRAMFSTTSGTYALVLLACFTGLLLLVPSSCSPSTLPARGVWMPQST